ncbi:MAG: hypothetical protein LBV39_04865 [Bacteroidales bacterium]|jgi:hypothetical protein|nr:hypothetical protein [Bacteroidales bacterium]
MSSLFLLVVPLVAFAFLGLGIGVWVKGKFPDTHIGHNAAMKKLGITCAQDDTSLCRGRQDDHCEGCAFFKPSQKENK